MSNRFKEKLKKWYSRQPEVTIFKPFRVPDEPAPVAFEWKMKDRTVKGFILRKDQTARVLSQRGNSVQITIPKVFVRYLKSKLKEKKFKLEQQKFQSCLLQFQNVLAFMFVPEHNELIEEVVT